MTLGLNDYIHRGQCPGNDSQCRVGQCTAACCECVAFICWRLANDLHFTLGSGYGNANTWASAARHQGVAVNGSPARGAVWQSSTISSFGHVAMVLAVGPTAYTAPDGHAFSVPAGQVLVEDYDWNFGRNYSRHLLPIAGSGAVFIHFHDLGPPPPTPTPVPSPIPPTPTPTPTPPPANSPGQLLALGVLGAAALLVAYELKHGQGPRVARLLHGEQPALGPRPGERGVNFSWLRAQPKQHLGFARSREPESTPGSAGSLERKALRRYGEARDPSEACFLLPDGRWLRWPSEQLRLAEAHDPSAYDLLNETELRQMANRRQTATEYVMARGWIRVASSSVDLAVSWVRTPTPTQLAALRGAAEAEHLKALFIDVLDLRQDDVLYATEVAPPTRPAVSAALREALAAGQGRARDEPVELQPLGEHGKYPSEFEVLSRKLPTVSELPGPGRGLNNGNAFILPDGRILDVGEGEHAEVARKAGLDYDELLWYGVVRYGAWGQEAFIETRIQLSRAQVHVLQAGLRELALRYPILEDFSASDGAYEEDMELYERVSLRDRSAVSRVLRRFGAPRSTGQGRERDDLEIAKLQQRLASELGRTSVEAASAGFILPNGTLAEVDADHFDVARRFGADTHSLELQGFARYRVHDLAIHDPAGQALYLEIGRPLSSAQRGRVRRLLSSGPTKQHRALVIDVVDAERRTVYYQEARDVVAVTRALRDADTAAARSTGQGRERDDLEQAAIARWGTTDDIWSAGWILPDGTMLDFKRRSTGFIEHHQVGEVLGWGEPKHQRYWLAIEAALERGWVRVLSSSTYWELSVELYRPLTTAQQRRIRDAAEESSHIAVDLRGGKQWYRRIQAPTPSRVMAALREANQAAAANAA